MEIPSIPVSRQERIHLLDIIRGIALCGILILNIYYFARPYEAMIDLRVLHESSDGDVAFWYITNFIVEGSYRALFSMLFGAGAILLISRLEKTTSGLQPADIYYRRLIWLLIFGLIDGYVLLWAGDILFDYAVCGLLLFPLRKASPRLLIGIATFFIAVTMFKGELRKHETLAIREKGMAAQVLEDQNKKLTADQAHDLSVWKERQENLKPEHLRQEANKEIEKIKGDYSSVWKYFSMWTRLLDSSDFYDNMFYDVMIFMLFGMAFYKIGILTGEKPLWVYVAMVIFGYGIGLTQGYFNGKAWMDAGFNPFVYYERIVFPFPMYQLHRLLVAMGHLGLIVLIWRARVLQWVIKPFAAVGQLAFTNYVMQTLVFTFIFFGYGLGYFGFFSRDELWYFIIGMWIFQLIFSNIWIRYFRFGPLEWLWRSLTYWKIQPFVKD